VRVGLHYKPSRYSTPVTFTLPIIPGSYRYGIDYAALTWYIFFVPNKLPAADKPPRLKGVWDMKVKTLFLVAIIGVLVAVGSGPALATGGGGGCVDGGATCYYNNSPPAYIGVLSHVVPEIQGGVPGYEYIYEISNTRWAGPDQYLSDPGLVYFAVYSTSPGSPAGAGSLVFEYTMSPKLMPDETITLRGWSSASYLSTGGQWGGEIGDPVPIGNFAYVVAPLEAFPGGPNELTRVPEPFTLILLGAGLAGLIGLRKKFKS
jgi:hypothetical protein